MSLHTSVQVVPNLRCCDQHVLNPQKIGCFVKITEPVLLRNNAEFGGHGFRCP